MGKFDEAVAAIKATGTQHDGTTVSDEAAAKRAKVAAAAAEQEAAAFTEEILKWLNDRFNERGFSAGQRVFSVALATVNLREGLPEDKGGKALFDQVAYEARVYYDKNKD
jgi:hypothetical protein